MAFGKAEKGELAAQAADALAQATERWEQAQAFEPGDDVKWTVEHFLQRIDRCRTGLASAAEEPRHAGQKAAMVRTLNAALNSKDRVMVICGALEVGQ